MEKKIIYLEKYRLFYNYLINMDKKIFFIMNRPHSVIWDILLL